MFTDVQTPLLPGPQSRMTKEEGNVCSGNWATRNRYCKTRF